MVWPHCDYNTKVNHRPTAIFKFKSTNKINFHWLYSPCPFLSLFNLYYLLIYLSQGPYRYRVLAWVNEFNYIWAICIHRKTPIHSKRSPQSQWLLRRKRTTGSVLFVQKNSPQETSPMSSTGTVVTAAMGMFSIVLLLVTSVLIGKTNKKIYFQNASYCMKTYK